MLVEIIRKRLFSSKNLKNKIVLSFEKKGNTEIAAAQKAYLKNHFDFFGIKSPERKILQKELINNIFIKDKNTAFELAKTLWLLPHRELHYFAQELVFKYHKKFEEKDIEFLEWMAVNQSWWDTIDFIAPKLLSSYFKQYPQKRDTYVFKWMEGENFWLQRCAILFQLKYKKELDYHLLSKVIVHLSESKEFFIQKAIGWILREIAKTNPLWVKNFVNQTTLKPLSKREAMKYIK